MLQTLDQLYAEWMDLQIRYIDAIRDGNRDLATRLRLVVKAAWNRYEDAQDRC